MYNLDVKIWNMVYLGVICLQAFPRGDAMLVNCPPRSGWHALTMIGLHQRSASAVKPLQAATLAPPDTVAAPTTPQYVPQINWMPAPITHQELVNMPLTRWRMEMARRHPEAAELELLVASLSTAVKFISNLVARSCIPTMDGQIGAGANGRQFYDIANRVLQTALRDAGKLGIISNSGSDAPMLVEEAPSSRYVAVFDPLDGSSGIPYGVTTGTIFGVYKEDDEEGCLVDFDMDLEKQQEQCLLRTLQPGSNMVAAGYAMYSSSTLLVIAVKGEGVHGFTLDPTIGEFYLTHPFLTIPKFGKIYSINESNQPLWRPALRRYVEDMKAGRGQSGKKFTARYIGCLTADVHRTLMYGGIWAHPGDEDHPEGKLKLLSEAGPISFILEQAGGLSSTGTGRILDKRPTSLHHRVPVFLGSPDNVQELERYYQEHST